MDPASWSAYSQHLSRLGASVNASSGSLPQAAQLNDLGLSSTLSRQDHLGSYGNAGGPHPFLLAASHGLNPSQAAGRGEHSFNASGLFVANYDASLLSASFQSSNKAHLSTFPQGAAGFFKTVGRDNDFADLRAAFAHCGMASYGRNPENNSALPGAPGLGSNALFPNSMATGSWRPPGIIPSSCGPFGVLPHETVLQRSHLVRRNEKQQSSKNSRSSHSSAALMEQDLSRSYRGILSSPARPPSSFVDHNNVNHPSLLSAQNDPYFSSVTDSYYSSCSKSDFAAYSSYCSNIQSAVQRNAISPYCYPQSYGSVESSPEKQEPSSRPGTTASANSSVPNSNPIRSHTYQQNGLVSRQTVITSNTSTNSSSSSGTSAAYNSQLPENQRQSQGQRESYNYPPSSLHVASNLAAPVTNSGASGASSCRSAAAAHSGSSHYSSISQTHYPPMSTPIPAATPAHPTPPSSMGQAHVPALLAMSNDSGCSVVYNSPSNDGCYSSSGACNSGSPSPAKQDMSQHSSPSVYSVESSVSINNSPFVDPNRMHSRTCPEVSQGTPLAGSAVADDLTDSAGGSTPKVLEGSIPVSDPSLVSGECIQRQGNAVPSVVPLDAEPSKVDSFASVCRQPPGFSDHPVPEGHVSDPSHHHVLSKHALPSNSEGCAGKSDSFPFSSELPPAIDYTHPKARLKNKHDKRKQAECFTSDCYSPNFSYPRVRDQPPVLPPQSHHVPVNTSSDGSPASDISSLPVDLSHVSLNLATKKDKSPTSDSGISEKCHEVPDLNYEHSILSSSWPVSDCDGSIPPVPQQQQQVVSAPSGRLLPEGSESSKVDEQTCSSGHSMDDISDESKNKLVHNLDDDLGFLAELSATSDVDEGASKESFCGKKMKKQHGFLQSFLTFLESSNEPTAPGDTGAKDAGKQLDQAKCGTPDLVVLNGKDIDSESHWLLGKGTKRGGNESKCDADKESIITIDDDDKDNFEEAPSLDSGLFGCSTLQKEMVVPNPEAPSFSSDEDENSAQGIFDSVAMAIQRLCDDDDNHERQNDEEQSQEKSEKVEENEVKNNEDGTSKADGASEEVSTKVPTLVVKQRKGKRRRGKHFLVIKVNQVKKSSTDDSQNLKAPKKPRRKPPQDNQKSETAVESAAENVGRRSLMRKCKQKRFQRNCEKTRKKALMSKPVVVLTDLRPQQLPADAKKKENTLSVTTGRPRLCKRKYNTDESDEQEVIVLDDDEDNNCNGAQNENKSQKQSSQAETTVKLSLVSSVTHPKRARKASKRKQKKKKRRNKPKEVQEPKEEEEEKNLEKEEESVPVDGTKTTVTPCEKQVVVNKHESTNKEETANPATEIRFKTGDYVTSADCSDTDSPPIWRIEGKNVLQLFEVFEVQETGILYKNTSSYSRWSPSSKHKYSKLNVNVIKCDDDTVIIEMPKKLQASDSKDKNGLSPTEDVYIAHPQRENFEVYLQTLVSHALDPDFIPEIVKENDEYFLSHLRAIEKITCEKKESLLIGKKWDHQFQSSAEMYPYVSVSMRKDTGKASCQLCRSSSGQYMVHFHGQLYDIETLESKVESKTHPVCNWKYVLCAACVQTVTLYSRLHHHKYHFYQLGCKKVSDVKKGDEKDSHAILEECLQDSKWMSQMFQDMMELWKACDKFR